MPLVYGLVLRQASEQVEVHVQVNDLFDERLPLCLCEAPPQRLQCGTYLQLFVRVHQEMLDLCEVQRCKVLQAHHWRGAALLLLLLLFHLLMLHHLLLLLLHLEPVLHLLLHRVHLLFERVVTTAAAHLVLLQHHHGVGGTTT